MDMKLFDKRIVRRNITKNLISQKEYERTIEGLEDQEDKCEPVEVSLYPSDEEEDEETEVSAEETTEPGETPEVQA